MRRTYVDGPWGQVHLRITGEGDRPPLLLLHPTPKSGWLYEPVMPLLAQDRIVIAPDTPGYGASEPPPAPARIEELAEAMLALAEQFTTGPVDVLGYHTGSVIAAAMADMAPARVGHVVFVSLAAYPAAVRAEKLARLAHWPGPAEDGSHLTAMWRLVGTLTDPRMDLAWRQASVAENLRAGVRTTWGYDAVYRYDLIATLDRLRTPCLILNPEDDLFAPTAEHAPRVAHARYVEMPKVGHGLFDVERAFIAREVLAFLDS